MGERPDLTAVSDNQLLRGLFDVLRKTRHDEAELVAHIAEVDARKLYAREASPSMFAWCTERLHLSEQEAYLRLTVARASREHPMLLPMLREGRLHLSGVARLVPHLTRENRDAVLTRAAGMSHRQVRELVAELAPRPDAPASIRKIPGQPGPKTAVEPTQLGAPRVESARGGPPSAGVTPTGSESRATPALDPNPLPAPPRVTVEPLAPARFKVQFTASAELRDKLERLQALMRRSAPDADLAKTIDIAVTRELERLEAKRFAKTKKPRKRLAQTDTRAKSRYIPAAVRRSVEKRDGGRCTYRDKRGRRCSKRHDLEFHHRKPFGLGGDHSPEGLALMCRTHNALLADKDFGREKMARHRRRGRKDAQEPLDSKPAEVVGEGAGTGGLRAQWRSTG